MKTTITIDGPSHGNWREIELTFKGGKLTIAITNWDWATTEAELDHDEAKRLVDNLRAMMLVY